MQLFLNPGLIALTLGYTLSQFYRAFLAVLSPTLEAELGITPNGYAEPDFMGWEVKQYGVTDFIAIRPRSPVTLMTPEPTGGIYRTEDTMQATCDTLAELRERF